MSLRRTARVACFLVLPLTLVTAGAGAEPGLPAVQRASGPTQVEPGNLMVFRGTANETWLILPHDGGEHLLFVVTVAADGTVSVTSRPLLGGDDPGDPPPPPEETLVQLVDGWADPIGDAANRAKLASAYEGTAMLIEQGSITTPGDLVRVQALANKTVLGDAAAAWTPFFEALDEHLSANKPTDMAAHLAAWLEIAEGLRQ